MASEETADSSRDPEASPLVPRPRRQQRRSVLRLSAASVAAVLLMTVALAARAPAAGAAGPARGSGAVHALDGAMTLKAAAATPASRAGASNPTMPAAVLGERPTPMPTAVPGQTLLANPSPAGADELILQSEVGFTVGDTVVISGDGHSEMRLITSFGSIVLDRPLEHAYPVGARVTNPEAAAADAEAATGPDLSKSRAVSVGGAGFLAFTALSGLTTGLLSAMVATGRQASLESLFGSFGIVSSTGGGAWFQSQLMYSEQFQALMYSMASQPDSSEELMERMYARFLRAGNMENLSLDLHGSAVECIIQMADALKPDLVALSPDLIAQVQQGARAMGLGDGSIVPATILEESLPTLKQLGIPQLYIENATIAVIKLNGTTPLSYAELVATLLERTGGIGPSMPLGSRVNPWAAGKLFLWCSALPVPGARRHAAGGGHLAQVVLHRPADGRAAASYTVETNTTQLVSGLLPVRFSYRPGEEDAPMTFCGDPSCFGASVAYSDGVSGATVMSRPLGAQFNAAFERGVSSLPISSVSAASSAFLSKRGLEGPGGVNRCVDLAVWADAAPGGRAFSNAHGVRAELFSGDSGNKTEVLAKVGLLAIGDAGDVDPTGVANAVAAGALNVTLLLVSDITGNLTSAYLGVTNIFPGVPFNDPLRVIFAEPQLDEVERFYGSMSRMLAPPGAKFLFAIAHGTLECVTAENPWFGIQAGLNITLDILSVETVDITAGLFQDSYTFDSLLDYGTLVGEVVATLAAEENREDVMGLLARHFGI